MIQFKVGDRVRYTNDPHGYGSNASHNPLWPEYDVIGTVTSAATLDYEWVYVKWDSGGNNSYRTSCLSLASSVRRPYELPEELFQL